MRANDTPEANRGDPPGSSFRQRFMIIIGLTLVMLVASGAAVVQLTRERDTASEQAARERGDGLVLALRAELSKAHGGGDPQAMSGVVDGVLSEAPGSSGGVCTRAGELTIVRTPHPAHAPPWDEPQGGPPRGEPRGPRPPHDHPEPPDGPPGSWDLAGHDDHREELRIADREVIAEACRDAAAPDGIAHGRRAMRDDILLASAASALDDDRVVFVLMRAVPPNREGRRGPLGLELLVMGAAFLLLVLVTVDSLLTLRRGALDLESALRLLQDDLHAPFPQPRSRELGRIGDGLRRMAAHLAAARENEAALMHKLEHEERLAALGRLVAGVAHEVRNPLAGIKLTLDGLARRPADAATHADVTTCLGEVARLDRIVSSLLGVARASPGDRRPIDLAATCEARARQLAGFAAERRVTLRCEGAGAIDGSPEVVVRALDNVLRNAIEASPEGGEVAVAIDRGAGGPAVVVLDQGPGVPKARLGELFEPFFTQKPEGVGLGLFSSRALMRAQGWDLLYERRADRTAFVLRFDPRDPHG